MINSNGIGVYGYSGTVANSSPSLDFDKVGVYGESVRAGGVGVRGRGTKGVWGSGEVGVQADTNSASGTGVLVNSTSTTGNTRGVASYASSSSGIGIYGEASSPTGTDAYAIQGRNVLGAGTGVAGFAGGASIRDDNGVGVYGESSVVNGAGLTGIATETTQQNWGVYGQSFSGTNGIGVAGNASSSTGITYGVEGKASSPNGRAVAGFGTATTGDAYGVYAETSRLPELLYVEEHDIQDQELPMGYMVKHLLIEAQV